MFKAVERRNDTKEENNDKSEGPKRGQGDFCPSSWDQNEHQERKSGEREEKQEKELREVGGKSMLNVARRMSLMAFLIYSSSVVNTGF